MLKEYRKLCWEIFKSSNYQENKKGMSKYLLNYHMIFKRASLEKDIADEYSLPTYKLITEMKLYLRGESSTAKYREKGIEWWNYAGDEMINSYPHHFKNAEAVLRDVYKGLTKCKSSRNWFIDLNSVGDTTQHACISYIQLQNAVSKGNNSKLIVTVYQRSADVSLGLPCDLYQIKWLIETYTMHKIHEMHWIIGNAHIYLNNIDATEKFLRKKERQKYIQNV